MRLPSLPYGSGIRKSVQVKFGGLNHTLGAGDGDLWDMENLTGDHYPALSTRAPRRQIRTLDEPGGLFSWNGLCWVDGDGFYYQGERRGTVTPGVKSFAALGAYVILLPDKAYYNTLTGEFGSLESKWSGTALTFGNGTYAGEEAECNALRADGVDWSEWFRVGDAVTISGCTVHTENNKTPIIREIQGDTLIFYEYVFTLDGDEGTEPYSETGEMRVERTVPDVLYLCENENRLWGCGGSTIYASKLGDIFNWNVFDGLASDSWSVDTGSAGDFTGCASYQGLPVFFKEGYVYEVYGSKPSNFEVLGTVGLGVRPGSAGSLAIAGEMLFYLSTAGVMRYTGNAPQGVGAAFGTVRHLEGAGGSDGLKYYASLEDEDGRWRMHVYDTRTGLWHTEDDTHATHFARWEGNLYFLTDTGVLWRTGSEPEEGEEESPFHWTAEFGDFTEESPNKKGVSKLQIRLELDEGASAQAWIQFDTDGEWERFGQDLQAHRKRSYYLPIVPRRGDHYRLKLEGTGGCRVFSLTREVYTGSEFRSFPGAQ